MVNPFYNYDEQRMRAFWRILIHLVLLAGFSLMFGMIITALKMANNLVFIASALGFTMATYIAIRFIDKDARWQRVGLGNSPFMWSELMWGTIAGFAAMTVMYVVLLLSGRVEFVGLGWNMPNSGNFWAQITWAMLAMMSVGYYEELMSRGYHIPNITEGFGGGKTATYWAVGVSSAFFGILHAGNDNATVLSIVNIVLAGIMLAIPFLWTKRLYLSIGLHFSWNFSMGAIFGFEVSGNPFKASVLKTQNLGPNWFTGGEFGPEGGFICLLGMSVALGIVYYIGKKHTPEGSYELPAYVAPILQEEAQEVPEEPK